MVLTSRWMPPLHKFVRHVLVKCYLALTGAHGQITGVSPQLSCNSAESSLGLLGWYCYMKVTHHTGALIFCEMGVKVISNMGENSLEFGKVVWSRISASIGVQSIPAARQLQALGKVKILCSNPCCERKKTMVSVYCQAISGEYLDHSLSNPVCLPTNISAHVKYQQQIKESNNLSKMCV